MSDERMLARKSWPSRRGGGAEQKGAMRGLEADSTADGSEVAGRAFSGVAASVSHPGRPRTSLIAPRSSLRLNPAPGTLLVAEPPLADPNFRRTVILLCEHSTEGSFGLVLNRPTGHRISEVAATPLPFDGELGLGGPVQPETLHYLHPYGDDIDGALPVVDGVYWGGEFEHVQELLETGVVDVDRFRFFVGYSGWGAGQLDDEHDEGSWIVLPATSELVWAAADVNLWRRVLRTMGGEYAMLSTYPDDPRLN